MLGEGITSHVDLLRSVLHVPLSNEERIKFKILGIVF